MVRLDKQTKEIKLITSRPGSTNGKEWVRFEFEFTDGFKVSCFDKSIAEQFKPGDVVEIGLIDKPGTKFKELVSIEKVNSGKSSEKSPISLDREKSIIAQTLTKCWAEMNQKFNKEQILETYKWFLDNL